MRAQTHLTSDDAAESIRRAYAGRQLPVDQIHLFRNSERVFPSRIVRAGPEARPLARRPVSMEQLSISSGGQEYDFFDYVSRNRVAGLLILKAGKVCCEHYEFGNDSATRWVSMSLAKSISSLLVGAAVQDGFIKSVDDPIVAYVPELAGSGYHGVSIRHILQMTSGVHWDDTHTDPKSERRHMLELQIAQQPGSILRFMASLPRVAEPGTRWNYSTGETHLVGALLKAATGRWLGDYLHEKIWSVYAMEAAATWWLESPDGLEVAGSGFAATLQDYGRLGLFMMGDGVIDGRCVLPPGWAQESGASRQIGGQRTDYGYMWWTVPAVDGTLADGAFGARGIFGQYIYINPRENVVIVVLSARAKPKNAEVIIDNDFFNAVAAALR